MGARTIAIKSRRRSLRPSPGEAGTVIAIVAAVALPMILAYVLVAMDMRLDLAGLQARRTLFDEKTLLASWPALELEYLYRQSERLAAEPGLTGARVRVIGYMMDGPRNFRDGEAVDTFILLPEAGHFLHPAHHDSGQMVEVRLAGTARFEFRKMVWAEGILARRNVPPSTELAAWSLTSSTVYGASPEELPELFKP